MVRGTGGADHARAAHPGELDRGAADTSRGAVDKQRAAAPDAELVKRARGRLDGGRQRGSVPNALAELVDNTRRLMAHGLRQLPIHQALALLSVARVHTGRAHRNPNLATTRMRIGEIHDLENLRAPEPAKTDCPHHRLRSRPRVSPLLRARQSANLRRAPRCNLRLNPSVAAVPRPPVRTGASG
jgi:hypothetical protein